jgi:hypothetical protein
VKQVKASGNDDVDTTTLQGHANHGLKKGMKPPTRFVSHVPGASLNADDNLLLVQSHASESTAHPQNREPVPPGGDLEVLGSGTSSQEGESAHLGAYLSSIFDNPITTANHHRCF